MFVLFCRYFGKGQRPPRRDLPMEVKTIASSPCEMFRGRIPDGRPF